MRNCTALAIVFLAAPWAPVATLSAQAPTANSLLQREVARALQRLGATDAFNARIKQMATPEEGFAAGAVLARHGLGRLDPATLQSRAEILRSLFAHADVTTCAQWSRGTLDPDRALALFNSADSATTSRWAEVSAKAMVAEMNATSPARPPSRTEASDAFHSVLTVLNDADRARYQDVMSRLASASDADMCWFSRAAYGGALRLQADQRVTTLNVFARLESQ